MNKDTFYLLGGIAVLGVVLFLMIGPLEENPSSTSRVADATSEIVSLPRTGDVPLERASEGGAAMDEALQAFARGLDVGFLNRDPLRPLYEEYFDMLGAARIIESVEERYPTCHNMFHAFGSVLRERTGHLETSLEICQDACSYACIHGVLRQHFAPSGSGEFKLLVSDDGTFSSQGRAIRDQVILLCQEDASAIKDFFRGNCAHAVGHAFGALAANLATAQAQCTIFEEAAMQYYCHSGIYMDSYAEIREHIFSDEETDWDRTITAVKFCNTMEWPSACLRFIPAGISRIRLLHLYSSECSKLEGRSRAGCFNGTGFSSRSFVADRPDMIDALCREGSLDDRRSCYSGMFFSKKDGMLDDNLRVVCARIREGDFRELCEDQLKRHYYQVDNPTMNLMFSGA